MSIILKVEHIEKEWNGNTIFQNVNFDVSRGERIALVGNNGVGKTTLLSAIMGEIDVDSGRIQRIDSLEEYGWLEQELHVMPDMTLFDFVLSGFHESIVIEDSEKARIQKQLRRIGLPETVWEVPYEKLSGGQKTKAQLIRLTIKQPKLLVLDEPTNHLDIKSLRWLENWLRRYPHTVLFVSHDRQFIDHIATSTIELTREGTRKYHGGYSAFQKQRELEMKTQQALYVKQQAERENLINTIQTYRNWFDEKSRKGDPRELRSRSHRKSTQNKHRNRMRAKEQELDRLESEMVELRKDDPRFQLHLDDPQQYMKTLLHLKKVTFGYSSTMLFVDVELMMNRGERIAIIGENGTGKSTLLKLISGEIVPISGAVSHHPSIRIGYLDQELMNIDQTKVVLDVILELPNMTFRRAKNALSSYMFKAEDWNKNVGLLSMGERCRLLLLRMVLSETNLLILDEPTNYLDVQSREEVEACLDDYPGALIFVSHDRYFINKIANRIITIKDTQVEKYLGTYDEWLHHSRDQNVSIDIESENRIKQLEFRLTKVMSERSKEKHGRSNGKYLPDNNEDVISQIREIQEEISQLLSQRQSGISEKPKRLR